MALQIINNNESGASVRQKLNNMFTELYNSLISVPVGHWHVVLDVLKPTMVDAVQVVSLSVLNELSAANNFKVNPDGSVQILDLGGFEPGTKKGLSVDSAGKIVLSDPEAGSIPVMGTGIVTVTGAEHAVDLLHPTIIVNSSNQNVNLTLPAAEWSKDAEVVVRKFSDDFYAVTINNTGVGIVVVHPGPGGSGNGCTTNQPGAWVRLKSNGADWYVIEYGGTWSAVM